MPGAARLSAISAPFDAASRCRSIAESKTILALAFVINLRISWHPKQSLRGHAPLSGRAQAVLGASVTPAFLLMRIRVIEDHAGHRIGMIDQLTGMQH